MAANEKNLTHDEIWDDSALVNSWNDALEEYKKYHSIHTKGGNVDDLINEKKSSDAKEDPEPLPQQEDSHAVKNSPDQREQNMGVGMENGTQSIRLSHSPMPGPAPVPAGLLGTVRDEGLKRLLMSWYYAGYYTGYYEGQREPPRNEESGQR
ncbi:hypothetical protein MGN70_012421 [Eutypa lata]|nr:hypothetical protein MGN70_012421 [Eutypa lata]